MSLLQIIAQIIAFVFVFAVGIGIGKLTSSPAAEPSSSAPVVSTTDSEVSDLIARLWPLAKEPDGEWYATGLAITFNGKRSVRIDLKTPDGNEYHGKATNLQDAAKRITEPSTRIKEALEGWSK